MSLRARVNFGSWADAFSVRRLNSFICYWGSYSPRSALTNTADSRFGTLFLRNNRAVGHGAVTAAIAVSMATIACDSVTSLTARPEETAVGEQLNRIHRIRLWQLSVGINELSIPGAFPPLWDCVCQAQSSLSATVRVGCPSSGSQNQQSPLPS